MVNIGLVSNNELSKEIIIRSIECKETDVICDGVKVSEGVFDFIDIMIIDTKGIDKDIINKHYNCARKNGIQVVIIVENISDFLDLIKNGVDKVIEYPLEEGEIEKQLRDVLSRVPRKSDEELAEIESKRLLYDLNNVRDSVLVFFGIDSSFSITDREYNIILKNIKKELAMVLSEQLDRQGFKIYKLRENKIAVLIYDVDMEDDELKQFIEALSVNLNKGKTKVYSGVSYSKKSDNLIQDADKALDLAYRGINQIVVYGDDTDKLPGDWQRKLSYAFMNDKILLYYQPILNNITQEVERFEALVRLEDSEGVVYGPFDFLSVSKDMGVYDIITKTVVEKALEVIREYNYYISVNICYDDVENVGTREFILNELERNKDISKYLSFELTEVDQIIDYDLVEEFISELKKYGCEFYIDDFGAGYSNYLKVVKLNVDYLKIDGNIIKEISENYGSVPLVKSIVTFSKDVGIKTVAEYVCNKQIYEIVRDLGVDYSQGYYIGKPTSQIGECGGNI